MRGGESGDGRGFLWVLWFHLPTLIPPTAPYSLMNLSLTLSALMVTASLNKKKKRHLALNCRADCIWSFNTYKCNNKKNFTTTTTKILSKRYLLL
jgi:hypothetical protein